MSNVKQVTIGGTSYNIGQAYAKSQKKLLSLIGATCALNASRSDTIEINVPFLKGALLSLPEEKLDQVTEIVFSRTFKSGEDRSLQLEDFQGKMSDYLDLVANGIKFNLQDFFIYLDEERAAMRPAKSKTKAV